MTRNEDFVLKYYHQPSKYCYFYNIFIRKTINQCNFDSYIIFIIFRSHILQADSENVYKSWIEALQQGIGNAIEHSAQRNIDQPMSQTSDDSNHLVLSNSNKIKKSK